MKRKTLRNFPLYLLASANLIYACKYGFTIVTYVAIALAAIVLAWDIWEVMHHGRK